MRCARPSFQRRGKAENTGPSAAEYSAKRALMMSAVSTAMIAGAWARTDSTTEIWLAPATTGERGVHAGQGVDSRDGHERAKGKAERDGTGHQRRDRLEPRPRVGPLQAADAEDGAAVAAPRRSPPRGTRVEVASPGQCGTGRRGHRGGLAPVCGKRFNCRGDNGGNNRAVLRVGNVVPAKARASRGDLEVRRPAPTPPRSWAPAFSLRGSRTMAGARRFLRRKVPFAPTRGCRPRSA